MKAHVINQNDRWELHIDNTLKAYCEDSDPLVELAREKGYTVEVSDADKESTAS